MLFRRLVSAYTTVLPSLQQRLQSVNSDTAQEADGAVTEGRRSAVWEQTGKYRAF
jgi:hypothetical protein